MSILLLADLVDHRARKAKERQFYSEQKEILEARLAIVRGELKLTDTILSLTRREQLVEVGQAK
jgi:RNA polymerase-interacting CarD/CdnL/TRCF family regulator